MPYHIPLTSADLGTGVVNFLIAFTRPYFMSDSDTDAWGRSSRGPHKFMTLLAISGINLGWSAYKTFFFKYKRSRGSSGVLYIHPFHQIW